MKGAIPLGGNICYNKGEVKKETGKQVDSGNI
jgi:hypothetical protein